MFKSFKSSQKKKANHEWCASIGQSPERLREEEQHKNDEDSEGENPRLQDSPVLQIPGPEALLSMGLNTSPNEGNLEHSGGGEGPIVGKKSSKGKGKEGNDIFEPSISMTPILLKPPTHSRLLWDALSQNVLKLSPPFINVLKVMLDPLTPSLSVALLFKMFADEPLYHTLTNLLAHQDQQWPPCKGGARCMVRAAVEVANTEREGLQIWQALMAWRTELLS
ncbi:hypothetical protein NEOLEDRAFT_1182703 [Neolentinus lepideus HHB14362 ss-1]|uniref:Uncharacterized protein n=1 Tax=Neolentinus lepideus HHB14362 ss-1 TaxID=1314782 RepID=A0A165NYQ0_9AGAM|nr:hypothetical protein NEOLEDRAFT_1182703 [Neolentinus lepideus HHB14362 ss-1]